MKLKTQEEFDTLLDENGIELYGFREILRKYTAHLKNDRQIIIYCQGFHDGFDWDETLSQD